jgi:hypothetical protein
LNRKGLSVSEGLYHKGRRRMLRFT